MIPIITTIIMFYFLTFKLHITVKIVEVNDVVVVVDCI